MAPKLPVLTGTRGDPQRWPTARRQPQARPGACFTGWGGGPLDFVPRLETLSSHPRQRSLSADRGTGKHSLQRWSSLSQEMPQYPRGRALSTGTLATLGYGDLFSETGVVLPSREPQGSPGPPGGIRPKSCGCFHFHRLGFPLDNSI